MPLCAPFLWGMEENAGDAGKIVHCAGEIVHCAVGIVCAAWAQECRWRILFSIVALRESVVMGCRDLSARLIPIAPLYRRSMLVAADMTGNMSTLLLIYQRSMLVAAARVSTLIRRAPAAVRE